MSDDATAQPATAAAPASTETKAAAESAPAAVEAEKKADGAAEAPAQAPVAEKSGEEAAAEKAEEAGEAAEAKEDAAADKPAEGAAAEAEEAPKPAADEAPAEEATPADKSKSRRKSAGGAAAAIARKVTKKGSRARITHLDAKPGDHYFVKLKGYPPWPAIICDESMLPSQLIKTRPVSAARPDGSYREDYADGGKRAHDRTYPVMYLYTYEFSWTPNMDLQDLDFETVGNVKDNMRKDLQEAHKLAAARHDLDYYKQVLRDYQDAILEQEQEKQEKAAAAAAEKEAKAAAALKRANSVKAKAEKAKVDEEGDVEMGEADESGEAADKKAKKRKADDAAPQRSDSVKKPKIKVVSNSGTTKAANGASTTPKPAKEKDSGAAKAAKPKSSKKEEKKDVPAAPKEPELTPEELRQRKEKEVLFLRHKLQKGLLTRDQEPKEEEMSAMSDYITKLEGFQDLEVSIIRQTKINKVLKAILKLESIPKEAEFKFKERSQVLLDKWNKLLSDVPLAPGPEAAPANGVNGEAPAASAAAEAPNGVKKDAAASDAAKPASEAAKTEAAPAEPVQASA